MFASEQTAPKYFDYHFVLVCVSKFVRAVTSPAHGNIIQPTCQGTEIGKALLEASDYAKMYHTNE